MTDDSRVVQPARTPDCDSGDAGSGPVLRSVRRGHPGVKPGEKTVRWAVGLPESTSDWLKGQPGKTNSEKGRKVIEKAKESS